jgi:ribosomal protein S18 acetylase RimI-like enzyme
MIDLADALADFSIPGYTVRRLASTDETKVQNFLEVCSDYGILENGRLPEAGDAKALLSDFPPTKSPSDKTVLAIEETKNVVALLDILQHYPDQQIFWIGLLLIHPDYRKKGLGKEIVNSLQTHLKLSMYSEIRLGVLEENHDGYGFWQRMGFKQIDLKPGRIFGQKTHTVIVMNKLLHEG